MLQLETLNLNFTPALVRGVGAFDRIACVPDDSRDDGGAALMRVFISWSKKPSEQMAKALREWLPEVIQELDPWMSSQDIAKGKKWSAEISAELDATGQGLICVTSGNQHEPWLNFEAGALAKSLTSAQVRPVLLDLQARDVTGPLAEFQATLSRDRDDMYQLVESLNAVCASPLSADRLKRAFDRTWPDLESRLDSIRAAEESREASDPATVMVPTRPVEDMFGEILERIRAVERLARKPASQSSKRPTPTLFIQEGRPIGSAAEQEALEVIRSVVPEVEQPTEIGFREDGGVSIRYDDGGPRNHSLILARLHEPLAALGVTHIEFTTIDSETGVVIQSQRLLV
jgi:hypothetical protein